MRGAQKLPDKEVRHKQPAWFFAACALVTTAWTIGCSDRAEYREVPKGIRVKDTAARHEHGEYGPHGGHLIELGEEEFHAELVLNPKTKDVAVYILGPDPQKAAPIDAKRVTLELTIEGKTSPHVAKPSTQQGDPPRRVFAFCPRGRS
jgi:hypothetical protein